MPDQTLLSQAGKPGTTTLVAVRGPDGGGPKPSEAQRDWVDAENDGQTMTLLLSSRSKLATVGGAVQFGVPGRAPHPAWSLRSATLFSTKLLLKPRRRGELGQVGRGTAADVETATGVEGDGVPLYDVASAMDDVRPDLLGADDESSFCPPRPSATWTRRPRFKPSEWPECAVGITARVDGQAPGSPSSKYHLTT